MCAGRDGTVGQVRGDDPEVERALPAQRRGPPQHAGVTPQQRGHLLTRAQVGLAGRGQPAVHGGQRPPGPDRGQRLGQPGLRGRGEMHVAGGHHAHVGQVRQPDQQVVALVVARVVLAGQLDHHVLVPEHLGQSAQLPPGLAGPARSQRRGHRPLAAPGQHHPVTAVRAGQRARVVDRAALLGTRQLGGADHGAQPGVAFRVAGQDQQVTAVRVGHAGLRGRQVQAELGAEHGAQADPLVTQPRGGLRELRDTVHPVVVGEGERLEPEPGGLGDELTGRGRPVQEAERGMAVQLGPRHAAGFLGPGQPRRPGNHVVWCASLWQRCRWAGLALGAPGHPPPQLTPGNRRVVPAHTTSTPPRSASGRPAPRPARPARRRSAAGTGHGGGRRPGPTSARTAATARPTR